MIASRDDESIVNSQRYAVCDCNLWSCVTCSCGTTYGTVSGYNDRNRRQRSQGSDTLVTRLSRVHCAKWVRIRTTREMHLKELHKLWRQSRKRPPQPRIERHPRIHRHSAKG